MASFFNYSGLSGKLRKPWPRLQKLLHYLWAETKSKKLKRLAKSVKDTISTQVEASLREKGEEIKRTIIDKVRRDLYQGRNAADTTFADNAIQTVDGQDNTTLEADVTAAFDAAFNAARPRGIAAQYLEATAAATAEAVIKAAKYSTVADTNAVYAVPGLLPGVAGVPLINIPGTIDRNK